MAKVPYFYQGQNKDIYDTQLNESLQSGISDNGYVMPSQTTSNITALSSKMPNGTIWYDSDTHELKTLVNGVLCYIPVVPV